MHGRGPPKYTMTPALAENVSTVTLASWPKMNCAGSVEVVPAAGAMVTEWGVRTVPSM